MAKKSSSELKKPKKSNKKSSKKFGPDAVAMKHKSSAQKSTNPFETIWSRRKFDILGKKRKGEEQRVGLSRSLAIEKRKKTLLKEYEQSGKSSVFLDKRIGEHNEELGEFDKSILRYQREHQQQQKSSKKSKYNLSDGEDDEFDILGGERFLGKDDFEDEVPLQEDEDDEQIESQKANMIHIKSLASFRLQMDIAERSNSLVVMFFYGCGGLHNQCTRFSPQLEDLIKQYRCNQVYKKINFLGTELRFMVDEYAVTYFPTVVVLKGDGKEVGRISLEETIVDCIFITGMRMLLDDCLRV